MTQYGALDGDCACNIIDMAGKYEQLMHSEENRRQAELSVDIQTMK